MPTSWNFNWKAYLLSYVSTDRVYMVSDKILIFTVFVSVSRKGPALIMHVLISYTFHENTPHFTIKGQFK